MQGYWNRPEATAEVLRDGWLWSGDLAAWDEEGFVRLRGRSKSLVISGGMNIYPAEIEEYLTSLEHVIEAAVFGVPDPAWGERLVAALALRGGTGASADALWARARSDLGIRCPKQWLVLAELPRTGNGKVDLRALKDRVQRPQAEA
jgi:acyl-CoA synthetase (AMP-forming)/AMP-acid ligase II